MGSHTGSGNSDHRRSFSNMRFTVQVWVGPRSSTVSRLKVHYIGGQYKLCSYTNLLDIKCTNTILIKTIIFCLLFLIHRRNGTYSGIRTCSWPIRKHWGLCVCGWSNNLRFSKFWGCPRTSECFPIPFINLNESNLTSGTCTPNTHHSCCQYGIVMCRPTESQLISYIYSYRANLEAAAYVEYYSWCRM